jgi:hypothetical protein
MFDVVWECDIDSVQRSSGPRFGIIKSHINSVMREKHPKEPKAWEYQYHHRFISAKEIYSKFDALKGLLRGVLPDTGRVRRVRVRLCIDITVHVQHNLSQRT